MNANKYEKGDVVKHKVNAELEMVIMETKKDQVKCRYWNDFDEHFEEKWFYDFEIEKK